MKKIICPLAVNVSILLLETPHCYYLYILQSTRSRYHNLPDFQEIYYHNALIYILRQKTTN